MSGSTSPVPSNSSLVESFDYFDEDALDRILDDGRSNTIISTETPDYASSGGRPSLDEQQRKEKKKEQGFSRTGKLKTVGSETMSEVGERGHGKLDTWQREQSERYAELPAVDFGPTLVYKPTSRPGTSGTLTPGDKEKRQRSRSRDRLRESLGSRLSGYFDSALRLNPGDTSTSRRDSYLGAEGQQAKGKTSNSAGASTFNPRKGTPDTDGRSSRLSMAWTPGAGNATASPSRAMTADEYVRYKAELAQQQPQYAPPRNRSFLAAPLAHGRHASTSDIPQLRKASSKTPPPFPGTASGDWSVQATLDQQRAPPSRPHSRAAELELNPQPVYRSGHPRVLTVQERSHVARATGTTLIDMVPTPGKRPIFKNDEETGLVGALVALDRDRAQLSHGFRGDRVRQEIDARLQQRMRQDANIQYRAQLQMQQSAQQLANEQALLAQQQTAQQIAQQTAMMAQMQRQQAIQMANPHYYAGQPLTQFQEDWRATPRMHQQQGYAVQQPQIGGAVGGQYIQQPQQHQQYRNQGYTSAQPPGMGAQQFMARR